MTLENCKYGCVGIPEYTQKKFKNEKFHYCRQCQQCGTIVQTNGKYWLPSYEIEPQIDAGLITIKPFIGNGVA